MSLFDLGSKKDTSIRKRLLTAFPAVSESAYEKEPGEETTTVYVQIKSGNGFLDRFRPPVIEKRYELDVFGTFVFRQIDTKRSVRDIIGLFKERFGLSRRESELGVVAFLKMLDHRKVIEVVETELVDTP